MLKDMHIIALKALERASSQHPRSNKRRVWQKQIWQDVKIIINMCANKP
jgi:hypothetical protein